MFLAYGVFLSLELGSALNVFKLYSVLHFSVCVVEDRIVLAQSIMGMELEIVTGILISFAHVLPCSQSF